MCETCGPSDLEFLSASARPGTSLRGRAANVAQMPLRILDAVAYVFLKDEPEYAERDPLTSGMDACRPHKSPRTTSSHPFFNTAVSAGTQAAVAPFAAVLDRVIPMEDPTPQRTVAVHREGSATQEALDQREAPDKEQGLYAKLVVAVLERTGLAAAEDRSRERKLNRV